MAAGHNPLDQFLLNKLIPLPTVAGVDLSLTNSAAAMLVALLASVALLVFGMGRCSIVPSRGQMVTESLHDMIANMVAANAGANSRPYFPFIFSIFMFIMLANMVGMLPYGFTATAHIIVTLTLALIVFSVVTLTGLFRHGFHFFSLFVPAGTPWWLAPILFVLELVAFCIRPFSLAVRLFANMMAGGILLKIFAGMMAGLMVSGLVGNEMLNEAPSYGNLLVAPFLFGVTIFLTGFKLFVAGLQAYIFSILSSVYLHDAIELH